MSPGDEVFRRIQSAARSAAAKTRVGPPTQEYLIRHTLESFLDRLTRTAHADDFVLKGGILLAAYGVRRPTKDADVNAIGADITADHLIAVVHDIVAIEADDGVAFDLDSVSVQEIREHADYPGFRVRVGASIGPWKGTAAWDVSSGDPIVPAPRKVCIDRVVGDPIVLLGYASETTIAEKGVTILERGSPARGGATTSTSSNSPGRASTLPSCSALREPWPATAALASNPSHRTSSATDRSARPSGLPGVARSDWRRSAKWTSISRWRWSPPTWIPCSTTVTRSLAYSARPPARRTGPRCSRLTTPDAIGRDRAELNEPWASIARQNNDRGRPLGRPQQASCALSVRPQGWS
ncbi:nucleotidyl transferase AbiEii/AbiGii toxin family protein [Ornithinicoccus hortensis]|uniref:Nucleotidyltransferase AbiEii toxin of type IV toxin-antitoxin system n=1 Tax=Ornithinicoccus hortensis TaxID=82346 RepID=A0A542YS08_9MICO|nr:nucleotidyl transferase AbiEii/AbiGii toxin family protein [Ornithinicoccus hortensis]TQL50841.1 nucleotidyltransferase AbiEii toxin of type IV toxin-antitoxin system [Ornithinicoccus hortensis]